MNSMTAAVMPMASTRIGARFFDSAGGSAGRRLSPKADLRVAITWMVLSDGELHEFVDGAHDLVTHLHQHRKRQARLLRRQHGADQVIALAAVHRRHLVAGDALVVVDAG